MCTNRREKTLAVLMLLFFSSLHAFAAFSMLQLSANNPDVTCDFRTGVATGAGAGTCVSSLPACNGVTDDTAAFDAFATWATGTWQASHTGLIALYIAPGSNCTLTTAAITFDGIKKLRVIGYGASLGGNYFHLGALGQQQFDPHSARVTTTVAGSTAVTLVTAGQTALFTTGQYAVITGLDLQGNGFPTNPFYFEYVKVISKDGACNGTGTICFDRALAETYKSTWPNYGGVDPDSGGPATLYALAPGWDMEVEWRGVTFTTTNPTDAASRQAVFRDTTFTQTFCLNPTMNYSVSLINSSALACNMEFDKLVQNATFTNINWSVIELQSSNKNLTITNSTIGTLLGVARVNTFSDNTFGTLLFGQSQGFGRVDSVVCVRCAVTTLIDGAGNPGGYQQAVCGTMSVGAITCAGGPFNWAVPGSNIAWTDDTWRRPWSKFWQITDVTQSGGNTIITTNYSGGFPTIPSTGGTTLRVFVHPAPKFTCTSCTGNAQMVSMGNAPAASPIWSYQQYTFTGSIGNTIQSGYGVWGNTTQINANVTNAYSGGALSFSIGGTWTMISNFASQANWTGVVNAKSVGNRQIALSGVTCPSGSCTGDSGLTLPNSTSSLFSGLPGANGPAYSADVSGSCPGAGCPSVTVTITADQGVVNP